MWHNQEQEEMAAGDWYPWGCAPRKVGILMRKKKKTIQTQGDWTGERKLLRIGSPRVFWARMPRPHTWKTETPHRNSNRKSTMCSQNCPSVPRSKACWGPREFISLSEVKKVKVSEVKALSWEQGPVFSSGLNWMFWDRCLPRLNEETKETWGKVALHWHQRPHLPTPDQ